MAKIYGPDGKFTDVTCDLCEKTCRYDDECQGLEFAVLYAMWGYGSPYDLEYHELDICPTCYEKLPFKARIRRYHTLKAMKNLPHLSDCNDHEAQNHTVGPIRKWGESTNLNELA